jgi:hypothetical protein
MKIFLFILGVIINLLILVELNRMFTVFQEKDAISLVSRMNRIHYKHMLVVANKLYLRDGGILSEWTSEPLTEPCGSGNVLKVDARS